MGNNTESREKIREWSRLGFSKLSSLKACTLPGVMRTMALAVPLGGKQYRVPRKVSPTDRKRFIICRDKVAVSKLRSGRFLVLISSLHQIMPSSCKYNHRILKTQNSIGKKKRERSCKTLRLTSRSPRGQYQVGYTRFATINGVIVDLLLIPLYACTVLPQA